MEVDRAIERQDQVGVLEKRFGLIPCVVSSLLAKIKNMKKGCKEMNDYDDWTDNRWERIPDAIAFQEAGVELDKAEKFLNLLQQNRNKDVKKNLCGARFKMAEKFMRLPFLNKTEDWNSIPDGTELKEAGVEFKKAKKFTDTKKMMRSIHNATKLKEGGVKFQKAKQDTLFSINFSNGVLEISPLRIEDETETFLRNLIAYEQYSPDIDTDYHYVTLYACFMDDLINSPKDVELLRHDEIIENWLGDDGVASRMFNKLGRHVTVSDYPPSTLYAQTCINMNKHCAEDWNEWMATLRHNHFNSPWALLSVLTAILLLGLTIIQTVFSIIN
ncbi:hypothetical protein I3843_01G117100 [Carya illinoinensis]|nr:hypothetical protein I3843_01G117100 [Carya illinoinensis]